MPLLQTRGASSTAVLDREGLQQKPQRLSLSLEVDADATSLGLVRHVVGGAARGLGMDAPAVADVRLALTETCAAAIGRAGPDEALTVEAAIRGTTLCVTVHDDHRAGASPTAGALFALPLVAAITSTVEVRHASRGGTDVVLSFALPARG